MVSKSDELRSLVDSILTQEIATGNGVRARDVTNQVMEFFTPEDFQQIGMEQARAITHDRVIKAIAATRRGVSPSLPTQAASVAEKRLSKAQRTWSQWLEYNGERHIQYPSMTKQDLLAAAQIRRARGEREIHLASLHELVAGRLNDGQVVGDVLTPEDIEQLSAGIRVRYAITWNDLLGDMLSLKGPTATAAD